MAHARAGYEFLLSTSRATLWLSCLVGVLTFLAGVAVALGALVVPEAARALAQPLMDRGFAPAVAPALGAAVGIIIATLGVLPLRRSLVQAYDCRIGEAGIYVATLTEQQQVIPWTRFDGATVSGAIAVIRYTLPDELPRQAWVAIPQGRGSEGLRLRTYLDARTRAANARREEQAERREREGAPSPGATDPIHL